MNLGNVYDLQGKSDLALKHYVKAIRLDAGQIPLLMLLGKRRHQNGDLLGTIQIYQAVLQVEPQHSEARSALVNSAK